MLDKPIIATVSMQERLNYGKERLYNLITLTVLLVTVRDFWSVLL